MEVDVLYYGFSIAGSGGHDIFRPDGHRVSQKENERLPEPLQWRNIDGRFPPQSVQHTEGVATFQHVDGWTVIAFWDRSGDRRPSANSAFYIQGVYPLNKEGWLAATALAKEAFPGVFDRMGKHGVENLQCVFNVLPV